MPAELPVTPRFTIGGPDDAYNIRLRVSGPDFQLPFTVDQGGLLWVVDYDDSSLDVWSAEGELINRWGSRGRGGDAFSGPLSIQTLPDGVWTWDHSAERLTRWSPWDGELGSVSRSLPHPALRGLVVIRPGGELWYLFEEYGRDLPGVHPRGDSLAVAVARLDAAGEEQVFARFRMLGQMGTRPLARPYARPVVLAAGFQEDVVTAPDHTYRLLSVSGEALRTWDFPDIARPYSEEERTASLAAREHMPFYPHRPDVQGLIRVGPGELWVKTSVADEKGRARYDRIVAGGHRTGSWWVPAEWLDIRIHEDRLYALMREESEIIIRAFAYGEMPPVP